MPNRSYPLKVFISHKVKEMGSTAREMANLFRQYGDKDKLEIFLSPETGAGVEWNTTVHEQLHNSDIFILLYLTYSTEMDWCLYESGFFAADATSNHKRKLICIHPENHPVPGPLEKWQNIETNQDGIIKLMHTIFNDAERPVKSELFTEDFHDTYKEIIDKLLITLGPNEVVTPLSYRVRITLPSSRESGYKEKLIEQLKQGIVPNNAWIWGETEALRQFGIGPTDGIRVNHLGEKLEYPEAIPFFQPILAKTMARILIGDAGPFSLPPVRVKKSGLPRTLVFTTLTERPNGDKIFEFVASEPLPTATCGEDDSFAIIYRLLAVALRFRRWVIVQYEKEINIRVFDKEDTEIFRQKVDKLLSDVLIEVNAVILDTINRGIYSRGQLIQAFEEDSTELEEISKIIEPKEGLWADAINQLYQAKETSDIALANEAMHKMRDLNKAIIRMSADRLAKLANSAG